MPRRTSRALVLTPIPLYKKRSFCKEAKIVPPFFVKLL